jgi:hypothetical protein
MLRQVEVVLLHEFFLGEPFFIHLLYFKWKVKLLEALPQRRDAALFFLQFLIQKHPKVNLLWLLHLISYFISVLLL